MLYRYLLHDMGDGTSRIGPELEATPCVLCGGESSPQYCPGDGRSHHHGCVHRPNDSLDPVCSKCISLVEAEWGLAKRGWAYRNQHA
jgi:hypothetical protein